jgi:hypothetical protein
MTYKDAFNRAVATFVAGASSAPVTSAVFDVSFVKAAAIAALVAAWNYLGRIIQVLKEERLVY